MATKKIPLKPSASWELVLVTPEMASEWLGLNVRNRNIRQAKWLSLARDITAGDWLFTGESVKFDIEGNLADGQHRLLAIVHAKKSVWMLVVRGLKVEAQDVLDSGAKRTVGDAFKLNGHGNSSTLAAGVRLAINWERGVFNHARTGRIDEITHSEGLTFLDDNKDMVEVAEIAAPWFKRIPAKPSVVLFTAWVTSRVDYDVMIAFYDDLASYRTAGTGDPRAALLRRLNAIVRDSERMEAPEQADLFFRAWNYAREGKAVSRFSPRLNGSFTDPI